MNYLKILNELFLYAIGGGLTFLINITSVYFLTEKFKLFYLISAVLGYSFSIIFNFIFQSIITFKKKIMLVPKFIKFVIIQLFSLLFYSFLIYIFTDFLKFYYLISVIISAGIVFIINFSLVKIFIFKK